MPDALTWRRPTAATRADLFMATSTECTTCRHRKPREHFKACSSICRMCERKAERDQQAARRKAKDAEQRRELRKLRERVRDLEAELEVLREYVEDRNAGAAKAAWAAIEGKDFEDDPDERVPWDSDGELYG